MKLLNLKSHQYLYIIYNTVHLPIFKGKKPSKQLVNNLAEASKFRQHVEELRRIGGSDWLRLLNEMNSSSEVLKYLIYFIFFMDRIFFYIFQFLHALIILKANYCE